MTVSAGCLVRYRMSVPDFLSDIRYLVLLSGVHFFRRNDKIYGGFPRRLTRYCSLLCKWKAHLW